MSTFSPRQFLRERNAVLVHFSTVMSRNPDLLFPNDLAGAMSLVDVPLSFSTILPGDTNPWGGGRGGAEGAVGLLVDIGLQTVIHSVSSSDSGSSVIGSLGGLATAENCAASIDQRETSNEWHVSNYVPKGLFLLPPILVRQRHAIPGLDEPILAEAEISLAQAIAAFPTLPVFSANTHTFLQYDRPSGEWRAVGYAVLIPQ